jgi:DNA-binding MarR family transcriptional regulator
MASIDKLMEKLYRTMNVLYEEIRSSSDCGTGIALRHSEICFLETVMTNKKANAGELARLLGISNPAISQIARKLIGKNLLEIYRIAKNKRETFFRLTGIGKKASIEYGKHHAQTRANFSEHCKHFSESDAEIIGNFLDAVTNCVLAKKISGENKEIPVENKETPTEDGEIPSENGEISGESKETPAANGDPNSKKSSFLTKVFNVFKY